MTQLRLHLMGAPIIEIDRQPVTTDRRKAIALLVYLAITNQTCTRDGLATLFWPEMDATRAFANLRRTLWEVNHMLGAGWLIGDRHQVRLNEARDLWVDVHALQQAVDNGELSDLHDAAALVRGDFLAGFSLRNSAEFDTWQQQQVSYWQRVAAALLEKLAHGLAVKGELETAVSTVQQWLALDPLQESAHRQLMVLYAQLGQRTLAICQYDQCVTTLKNELDIPPEQETIDLFEQIKSGNWTQSVSIAAPQRKPAVSLHNLPVQPTSFVGRQSELIDIGELLQAPTNRLITLTGPGGSGKTRLALEVARTVLPHFADGVWFVSLAALRSVDSIVTAVAKSLHFTFYEEGSSVKKQLLDFLRNKKLLLLMDNYEHLLESGGAAFVSDCLSVAADVKILTTSRMRLNVQGEVLYGVTGMSLPDAETAVSWQPNQISAATAAYSALQLFQQSAGRVQSGFSLLPENIVDVTEICRLVHGLPLGIELAASWMEMLSVTEIRAEISENLDFLETEVQDVPQRQRSLRAVFNYSWELMNAEEKQLFPQLALFQGGFSRDAAQKVAQTNLRTLMRLVNKSLVRREENGRFAIHELLRQYATEKIQEDAESLFNFRSRHSLYYLHFLAKQSLLMQGPQQRAAYDVVEQELGNILAAWFWGLAHGAHQIGLAALSGLFNFYLVRANLMLMIEVLELVVEDVEAVATAELEKNIQSSDAQLLHASLIALLSFTLSFDFASNRTKQLCQEALHLADAYGIRSKMGVYFLLNAEIYMWRIHREQGAALVRESLAYIRQDGDVWSLAVGLSIVGGSFWASNMKDEGRALINEGIALSRQLGDRIVLAYLLGSLAHVTGDEHDFDTTLSIYEECREIYESVGNRGGVGNSFIDMGATYDAKGEYEQALIYYRRGRDVFEELGDRHSVARALSWESLSARRMGQYEYALTLRGDSQALYEKLHDVNSMAWCYFENAELTFLTGDAETGWRYLEKSKQFFDTNEILRGHAFYFRVKGWMLLRTNDIDGAKTALKRSVELSVKDYHNWNVSCARSWLGLALLADGDVDGAYGQMVEALSHAKELSNLGVSMLAIAAYAQLLQRVGAYEGAVELAAFVEAHPALWYETRSLITAVFQSTPSHLDEKTNAAAKAKGRAWKLDDLLEKILTDAENR